MVRALLIFVIELLSRSTQSFEPGGERPVYPHL